MRPRRDPAGWASLLAATILCAGVAHAQGVAPAWQGFYVGGGAAYSTVSVQVGDSCYDYYYDCWWGDYYQYDTGDGAFGYSLHAGWRVYRYVALEAGYLDTGSIEWDRDLVYMPEFDDYYNNRVDFSAEVAELSILGILPFAERWEVYLRLGAGIWDGTSRQRLDQSFGPATVRREVEESDTGLLIGLGGGVTFGDGWHLRLDLQTVTIDGDVLNTREDTSLDSFLLEVQYRFGAPRATAPPIATP